MRKRIVSIAIAATISASAQSASPVTVPFVGCPSEGQAGPLDRPTGSPKAVALPADLAEQIAYYIGEQSQGVFAPRGWHCQVVYGSSGGTLVVAPARPEPSKLYQSRVLGHAIELEGVSGDTSGRYQVAAFASLLFPKAAAAFIKHVRDDEPEMFQDEAKDLFHAQDLIDSVASNAATFTTPANAKGLGTACSLAPTADAIHGIAVYSEKHLAVLRVRLGPKLANMEAAILKLNQECMLTAGGC